MMVNTCFAQCSCVRAHSYSSQPLLLFSQQNRTLDTYVAYTLPITAQAMRFTCRALSCGASSTIPPLLTCTGTIRKTPDFGGGGGMWVHAHTYSVCCYKIHTAACCYSHTLLVQRVHRCLVHAFVISSQSTPPLSHTNTHTHTSYTHIIHTHHTHSYTHTLNNLCIDRAISINDPATPSHTLTFHSHCSPQGSVVAPHTTPQQQGNRVHLHSLVQAHSQHLAHMKLGLNLWGGVGVGVGVGVGGGVGVGVEHVYALDSTCVMGMLHIYTKYIIITRQRMSSTRHTSHTLPMHAYRRTPQCPPTYSYTTTHIRSLTYSPSPPPKPITYQHTQSMHHALHTHIANRKARAPLLLCCCCLGRVKK